MTGAAALAGQADVLIVGAGHAGVQAAVALRQKGFEGSVTLLGAELHPPYERPPLSKEYLSGEKDFERMLLRPQSFWEAKGVELKLGVRVVGVEPLAQRVMTADGDWWGYGSLIWAAGGSARRLSCPGADLKGVHVVRTRDDADALRCALDGVERVVVVGGGYVGLEAAAAFVKAGKAVTLVEQQDRLLARVAGQVVSDFYLDLHRRHGVDVRLCVGVEALEGAGGCVTGVVLADGECLPTDLVVAGVGLVPSVAPLLTAGADGQDGVDVDPLCRTSLPHVFAIGDCARHVNVFADGARIRVESVQNANDQAQTVAGVLTGGPKPYESLPWFWSNQYDVRLQTVGLSTGCDQAVVRGEPTKDGFSVVYLRAGRVVAMDCINATRDYVQGRALITGEARIAPEQLADPDRPLKDLAVEAESRALL